MFPQLNKYYNKYNKSNYHNQNLIKENSQLNKYYYKDNYHYKQLSRYLIHFKNLSKEKK